jgi:hypothetical protein
VLPEAWMNTQDFEVSATVSSAFRSIFDRAHPENYASEWEQELLTGSFDEEVCVLRAVPLWKFKPECQRVRVTAVSISDLLHRYLALSLKRLYSESAGEFRSDWLEAMLAPHVLSKSENILKFLKQKPEYKTALKKARKYVANREDLLSGEDLKIVIDDILKHI